MQPTRETRWATVRHQSLPPSHGSALVIHRRRRLLWLALAKSCRLPHRHPSRQQAPHRIGIGRHRIGIGIGIGIVPTGSGQATRAHNALPTFVAARNRRESRFPPSYPARPLKEQLSRATQTTSRFVVTPQQSRRPPPVSSAAARDPAAPPNAFHVVPAARGASSRPAPSASSRRSTTNLQPPLGLGTNKAGAPHSEVIGRTIPPSRNS